ncbi:hypothetical protein [Hydrogenibacillus sp. N12]|uniref:hypothetical protein n=1 Tax=Hydrogenibacillus sp. N12 TaxID=2866627 RepID=UPI001C7D8EB1|nr:hypothetical protein [Hydrogenibacillus sp. N12]QZA32058.1 hypothetical protein K2M58_06800 [Hydrogenibacillus sp. N12]
MALVVLVGLYGCAQQQEPGPQNIGWTEVAIDTGKAKLLQEEVDNGHRPGLLDPHQVIYEFLEGQLRILGSEVQEIKEVDVKVKEIPEGKVIQVTLYDGKVLQFSLVQPVRKGPTGIWQVKGYRFLK